VRGHWEESRSDRRRSELRHERRARRRGHRARSHLARAQHRRRLRLPRLPEGRASRGLLFALSLGLGALSASWLSQAWLDWSEYGADPAPSVSIQGASRLSPEAIATTAHWTGTPAAIEAQLEEHPWIREARVLRLPTGAWLVRVDERQPFYRLTGTPVRLVDRDGVVFAEASEPDAGLPLVTPSGETDRARTLSEAMAIFVDLEVRGLRRRLEASGAPIELVQSEPASRRGWVLRVPYYGIEVVLGEVGPTRGLAQLERLLGSSLAAELPGKEIDLRFAQRAIVRSAVRGPDDEEESSPASG